MSSDPTTPDVERAKDRLRAAHRTNRQYAEEDLLTMARIVQAYDALGGDPNDLRGER